MTHIARAAACLALLAALPAAAIPPQSVAVLDFELVNDMAEYDAPEVGAAQQKRLVLISEQLRDELARRGLYRVADNAPARERIERIKVTYNLRECKGCEVEIGRALEVDRIITGWVQKVSNLILNLNIEVRNVANGQIVYNKSVDLRGNTDESWQRGIRYMVRDIEEKKQHLR